MTLLNYPSALETFKLKTFMPVCQELFQKGPKWKTQISTTATVTTTTWEVLSKPEAYQAENPEVLFIAPRMTTAWLSLNRYLITQALFWSKHVVRGKSLIMVNMWRNGGINRTTRAPKSVLFYVTREGSCTSVVSTILFSIIFVS